MEFGDEFNRGDSNARTSSFMPQRHKTVWLFHFLFRTLAIATYLFGGFFFSTFISRFIAILALISADFWWVKNVSGRILVGMRWWNIVDDAGGSQWHFESRAENSASVTVEAALQRSFESNLFWLSLVAFQIVWVLFLLLNLFTFRLNWFVVTLIANVMSGSNLYGYVRCRYGRDGLLSGSTILSLMGPQMLRSALSSVVSAARTGAATSADKVGGFAAAQPSFATQTMSM